MKNLTNINTIKELLEKYGFKFSKSLGQNFLINPSVCPKIAELGKAEKGYGILEIGTGFGTLTAELAKRADKVTAVEIDSRLLPVLEETLSDFNNINVINDDIMKVNIKELIATEFSGMKKAVCANLPYYITTPIVMGLLESRVPIESITVMVQKEVAERMKAGPGTKEYGALSLAVQYYAKTELAANVPPNCFMPRPKIGSAVIHLTCYPTPPVQITDEKLLFALIRASFNQRRKTLVNGLSHDPGLSLTKEQIHQAIEQTGLPLTVRGEELTLEQFAQLAETVRMVSGISNKQ